jgi:hypothetical protein
MISHGTFFHSLIIHRTRPPLLGWDKIITFTSLLLLGAASAEKSRNFDCLTHTTRFHECQTSKSFVTLFETVRVKNGPSHLQRRQILKAEEIIFQPKIGAKIFMR